MKVYDYSTSYHAQMAHMLGMRGCPLDVMMDLPATGVIVLDDQLEPIASGFLRLIEGDFGLVDGFVSNPDFTKQERALALDQICMRLKEKALQMKLHTLFVFTSQDVVEERALRYGFNHEHQIKLLSYSLTQGAGICHF